MVEQSTNVIRFYRHWKQNNLRSEREGRLVGEEFDYIEIHAPGNKLSVVKRRATQKDQSDYPREWELYRRGKEQVAKGTPLCEWEVMTEGTVAMLKHLNIHTLEALVELSDAGLQNIGTGARQLQSGARLFLEQAPSKVANPPIEGADLRVENERLTARVAELEVKTAEHRAKIKRQTKKIATRKTKRAA